jgi:hypothetical protein
MALTLTIKPAGKVIGSIPTDDLERTPVLLGLKVEKINGDVKLLADVVFQRIPVKGPAGMGPWYIAASDAQITLRANGAGIKSYTESKNIATVHIVKHKKASKVEAKIEPKVELSETLSVSVVNVGAKLGRSKEETIEYSDQESELTALPEGDRVLWVRSSPPGEKLIREYILENLHLWMQCKWEEKDRRGSAKLVTFPDLYKANGKKCSLIKTFFAVGLLKLHPPLANEGVTTVDFTCDDK